jgi:hypothetical protein
LPKVRNKARVYFLSTASQHHTGGPTNTVKQGKIIKSSYIEKVEIKLVLFLDDMIIYVENPTMKYLILRLTKCVQEMYTKNQNLYEGHQRNKYMLITRKMQYC